MKKFLLAVIALAGFVSQDASAVITAAQKYKLNNQFGLATPKIVQLGSLIEMVNANMDPSVFQYKDTTLTTAQILALNTTPITLVAAPGAGKAILVRSLYATITYNSAAYSCNAAGLIARYTDGSGTAPGAVLTQGFCQSSANAVQVVEMSSTAYTPTVNAPIVLHAGAANPTTGNSAIKVRVYYVVAPHPLP